MSDLEAALAAAVGARTEQPEGQPLALNDDDGLRGLILRELHEHDANKARQKQTQDALQPILNALNKK